jgi:hypothetical protein
MPSALFRRTTADGHAKQPDAALYALGAPECVVQPMLHDAMRSEACRFVQALRADGAGEDVESVEYAQVEHVPVRVHRVWLDLRGPWAVKIARLRSSARP